MSDSVTIEFCTRNVDMDRYQQLLDLDVDVRQQHCLNRCGRCRRGQFLIINGSVFEAAYHEILESVGVDVDDEVAKHE